MRVKVKAVGWLERVFKGSEVVFGFDGDTVKEFLETASKQSGVPLGLDKLIVLVNGVGVKQEAFGLKDGDTIMLLPIMSGG
ncbi:MAG: MoaD/ThiS family protein [Planctomycetota bacterium]|nr:MoaD/ThiS family protein [Planctomycetota bacterium]